jgi:hypothetical protein
LEVYKDKESEDKEWQNTHLKTMHSIDIYLLMLTQ